MNWSNEDERTFITMKQRREKFKTKQDNELRKAIAPIAANVMREFGPPPVSAPGDLPYLSLPERVQNAMFAGLAQHADNVRDALKPYDSGARCKPEEGAGFPPTPVALYDDRVPPIPFRD